jgi:hypothetical protein
MIFVTQFLEIKHKLCIALGSAASDENLWVCTTLPKRGLCKHACDVAVWGLPSFVCFCSHLQVVYFDFLYGFGPTVFFVSVYTWKT